MPQTFAGSNLRWGEKIVEHRGGGGGAVVYRALSVHGGEEFDPIDCYGAQAVVIRIESFEAAGAFPDLLAGDDPDWRVPVLLHLYGYGEEPFIASINGKSLTFPTATSFAPQSYNGQAIAIGLLHQTKFTVVQF